MSISQGNAATHCWCGGIFILLLQIFCWVHR